MPRVQTYEFTAFTEADLLGDRFDYGSVYGGEESHRADHEEEIDVYDIQWGAAQSPAHDGAGSGLKAEAPQPSLDDAAAVPASDTFDLLF